MALVSSSIPNLVGGVSQQPPALRVATSGERVENAWSSVVSGLQKRPPTEHIAKVGLAITNGVAGYLIERSSTYRYMALITNGDLKVLNLNDGTFQTVTFPAGKAYLTSTTPVDSFRFVTFGDFTFIANRKITVAKASIAESSGTPLRLSPLTRGTIYVALSAANSYYTIYINNVLKAEYLSPKGVDAASSVPDTGFIADKLRVALEASGYTVTKRGSTLTISNLVSTDKITVQAGSGDRSLKAFKDSVQSFSDLPPQAPEGLIVRVKGDVEEAGDDYYVVFRGGVWEETLGYSSGEGVVATSMPHVLVRESDGTWSFAPHVWEGRSAGDEESNKSPSFVGATINDIFVYTNRLGFLADENVILSESDAFENFYRTTTTQALDSDRIDIAVLHNNVDILQHAIAYNRDLLLMSNTNQFRLSYQNFLSAKNTQIRYTTSFNVSSRIRPINMGNSLYFIDDRADYSFCKVLEYYPKENVVADDADEVSASVPEYIPSDITFMAGSNRADAVLLSSNSDPASLYFYKFFWSGDRKVQTAWSKWTFNDCVKIHWGTFSGTYMYILIQRAEGLCLESIKFDEDVFDTPTNYSILLDRRTKAVTMTYNATSDRTFINLPWSTTHPHVEIVSTGQGVNGYRHPTTKVSDTQVSVSGNITTHTVTAGLPYTLLYEFSTLFPRQAKGQGEVVILDARLQVRYLSVEYHDTAFFKATLTLPGRSSFVSTFSGKTVGSPNNTLGTQSFASGVFRIPVMSRNTDVNLTISNDTPYPSAFGAAEWQGELTLRSRKRM